MLRKAEVFEPDGEDSVLERNSQEEHWISLDYVEMQVVDFFPVEKQRPRKKACAPWSRIIMGFDAVQSRLNADNFLAEFHEFLLDIKRVRKFLECKIKGKKSKIYERLLVF